MSASDPQTHFGYRQVPLAEKQTMVDGVFQSVAHRYDLMNDLMSAGLHRAWKSALVTAINPPKNERSFHLLDIAGGTGDIAIRTLETGSPRTSATVLDINDQMLAVGRERAQAHGLDQQLEFRQGNAEALPFADNSFDACSVAFGIRNVPHIALALTEARRVLRPGGHFVCLEFSHVDVPGLDLLYELYSFQLIPRLGRVVTGDADAYRYLVESIRKFPKPDAFAEMMRQAAFARVSYSLHSGGIVAMHSGWRL